MSIPTSTCDRGELVGQDVPVVLEPASPADTLDAPALAKLLNVNKRTVIAWRASGFLPAPIYASAHATVWRRVDIYSWIQTGYRWSRPERAKALVAAIGQAELNKFITPSDEAVTASEAARLEAIADRLEKLIERSDAE